VKITYEGEQYDFDFDEIGIKQAIKIEKHVGMPLSEWGEKLSSGGDLLAVQALGWLILFGGKGVPVDDADFKVVKFGEAFQAAQAAEQAEDAATASGPTVPGGNGRPAAATIVLSPLSSETVSP
jgi:hypothetical protein